MDRWTPGKWYIYDLSYCGPDIVWLYTPFILSQEAFGEMIEKLPPEKAKVSSRTINRLSSESFQMV